MPETSLRSDAPRYDERGVPIPARCVAARLALPHRRADAVSAVPILAPARRGAPRGCRAFAWVPAAGGTGDPRLTPP